VAAVGALLAVALLAWLLVPGTDDSATDLVSAGTPAGEPAAAAGGTTATTLAGAGAASGPDAVAAGAAPSATPTAGAGAGATGGAAAGGAATPTTAGAAAAGATCPAGSATGISGNQVKVGVGLTVIGGPAANNLFGIPTPDVQRSAFDAVIASVNAGGGAGCKKIVAQYFNLDPTNQEGLVQKCREAADAGVFAFVDSGGYTTYPAVECFGQRKIAYFGGYFGNTDRNQRNYPYLFNLNLLDTTYRNALLVLKARGAFSQGFQKLGFVYRSCDKPLLEATKRTVREVVPASSIVEYDVGCPTAFANPADISQAILTFQRSGVTHVTTLGMLGDMANFTNVAEQQRFRPKYVLADDGIVSISYGSQAPNAANFANAIAITTNRGGEERTPGVVPTAGTARCDAILKAKGMKPTWQQPALIGNACNQLWMLKASMDNAATLRPDALAAGLQKARSIDFSFPQGPTAFAAVPRTTTGGQFQRPIQFFPDCKCWRLLERDFKPIVR
jgi:hypothetical protein